MRSASISRISWDPTLAGASLFAAALYPGRFRSLVVGTGGTAYPLQLGGVLKEWVEVPSVEPYRKIDGRQIVSAALSTLQNYRPSDAAREDYLASFSGERFAESMRYVRSYPEQLAILANRLGGIENSGADHQRLERSCGTTGQCSLCSRAIASKQARHHRRRAFHLGRRCRYLRHADQELVGRWLRKGLASEGAKQ